MLLNSKYRKGSYNTICYDLPNVAGDILVGTAIGLVSPITPVNHVSMQNIKKMHRTITPNDLKDFKTKLNEDFKGRCKITSVEVRGDYFYITLSNI